MKNAFSSLSIAGLVLGGGMFAGLPDGARAMEFERDAWSLRLDLIAALQGAYFEVDDGPGTESDTDGVFDFTARATGEYAFENGWVAGVRVEYDSDFDEESDVGGGTDFDFVRDEVYGYLATPWALVEIGEQDGPADRLSYHAPTLGLGQIRGNFSRYAGSSALLSPFDTQDSPKLVVTSAPWRGLRAGVSYGADYKENQDEPNPRRRTIQENPIEIGVQYQRAVGDIVLGVSGAYVTADADPITEREDISSWSAGGEARWNNWRVGAAYVDRGDSNGRLGRDESEVNYGVAWDNRKWGVAASGATIDRSSRSRQLAAIGGFYRPHRRVFLRSDLVYSDVDFDDGRQEDSIVFVTEIEFRL